MPFPISPSCPLPVESLAILPWSSLKSQAPTNASLEISAMSCFMNTKNISIKHISSNIFIGNPHNKIKRKNKDIKNTLSKCKKVFSTFGTLKSPFYPPLLKGEILKGFIYTYLILVI